MLIELGVGIEMSCWALEVQPGLWLSVSGSGSRRSSVRLLLGIKAVQRELGSLDPILGVI